MKPVLKTIKKKTNLFISIIVTVVISYFIYTDLTNSFEHLNPYYILRFFTNPPKVYTIINADIYLPRMASVISRHDLENQNSIIVLFMGNGIKHGVISIFELKDVSDDIVKNMFKYEAYFYSKGDILPLIYVFSYDSKKIYIMYRNSWELETPTGLPWEAVVMIPEKKLLLYINLRDISEINVMNIIKILIFNDSSMDFDFEEQKTLEILQ